MSLQRTPLFESCRSAGGRMVPFAGWEMPVQFSGLIQEHKAVRERVGMFDISHMGVLRLEGANPKDALQRLVPSDLHRIGPGEACYSVLLNEQWRHPRRPHHLRLRCHRCRTGCAGAGDQCRLRRQRHRLDP